MIISSNERTFAVSSNIHRIDFPKNNASNFRNRIDTFGFTAGAVNPKLEIALFQSFIPKRYRNIANGECRLLREGGDVRDFKIPSKYYPTPKHVCIALNEALKLGFGGTRKTAPMVFAIKKGDTSVLIRFKTREFDILLSDNICEILGFAPGVIIRCPSSVKIVIYAPYTASPHSDKTELYVYMDCIEKNYVASRGVQLLTILHWIPGQDVNNTLQSIDEGFLVWHKVQHVESIDSVRIMIADSAGEPIDFYGANSTFRFFLRNV